MELEELRAAIRSADRDMNWTFEKRMSLVKQVAAYKIQHDMPIYDAEKRREKCTGTVRSYCGHLFQTCICSLVPAAYETVQEGRRSGQTEGSIIMEELKGTVTDVIYSGSGNFFCVLKSAHRIPDAASQ